MAKRTAPELAASNSADKPGPIANSDELQARNPLIGMFPHDTMDSCADVLAFLEEFHMRFPANAQDIEHGETIMLRLVKNALRIQCGIEDGEGNAP